MDADLDGQGLGACIYHIPADSHEGDSKTTSWETVSYHTIIMDFIFDYEETLLFQLKIQSRQSNFLLWEIWYEETDN